VCVKKHYQCLFIMLEFLPSNLLLELPVLAFHPECYCLVPLHSCPVTCCWSSLCMLFILCVTVLSHYLHSCPVTCCRSSMHMLFILSVTVSSWLHSCPVTCCWNSLHILFILSVTVSSSCLRSCPLIYCLTFYVRMGKHFSRN